MNQIELAVTQVPLASNDEGELLPSKDVKQEKTRLSDAQLSLVGGGDSVLCW